MLNIENTNDAIHELHRYILDKHYSKGALIGPDPGLRYNFRIWRFLKSYLPAINWQDQTYFLQCQGYWIWNNWEMYKTYEIDKYKDLALACSERVLAEQKQNGYWEYPLKEWKDKIATVDGDYAARGLMLSFENSGEKKYLNAAINWFNYLTEQGGFQKYKDSLVIRYFAGKDGRLVPNNVTLTLTFIAELWHNTKNDQFLKYNQQMIRFLQYALRENGEFPYAMGTDAIPGREHFLCFQYNCFQFLDLVRYWELTKNEDIYEILSKQIAFIKGGQCADGHSKYNCYKSFPEVTYYSAVMGAAFLKGTEIGLGNFENEAAAAFSFVHKKQNNQGGFPYSRKNYGLFSDKRSYPRYLVMILKHLLIQSKFETEAGNALSK